MVDALLLLLNLPLKVETGVHVHDGNEPGAERLSVSLLLGLPETADWRPALGLEKSNPNFSPDIRLWAGLALADAASDIVHQGFFFESHAIPHWAD
jgi:hypothetical protein